MIFNFIFVRIALLALSRIVVARIYFSLAYSDYRNATLIYNACKFKRAAESILFDETIWDEARKNGEAVSRELVDRAVERSDVTVFLVGEKSYLNKWCQYALQVSVKNEKGVFGIYLPNQMSRGKGDWITRKNFPIYEWDSNSLHGWIIKAIQKSLTKAS